MTPTLFYKQGISLMALLLLPVIAGCTHNNGDIGPLYGNWKLETVDTELAKYRPAAEDWPVFWGFQSSTIRMAHVGTDNSMDQRFGNYRLYDNTLFLEFTGNSAEFHPLLSLPDECELQVLELSGKRLVVRYIPGEGEDVVYTFRKW